MRLARTGEDTKTIPSKLGAKGREEKRDMDVTRKEGGARRVFWKALHVLKQDLPWRKKGKKKAAQKL